MVCPTYDQFFHENRALGSSAMMLFQVLAWTLSEAMEGKCNESNSQDLWPYEGMSGSSLMSVYAISIVAGKQL